jgi:hypothetical protein
MKNLKVLVFIAAMFGFFSSLAHAQTEVAVSGFVGFNPFTGAVVQTNTLAPDCRTQIFAGSFGTIAFGVFCEGSSDPQVVIVRSGNFCNIQAITDPDYTATCFSNGDFTVRR